MDELDQLFLDMPAVGLGHRALWQQVLGVSERLGWARWGKPNIWGCVSLSLSSAASLASTSSTSAHRNSFKFPAQIF